MKTSPFYYRESPSRPPEKQSPPDKQKDLERGKLIIKEAPTLAQLEDWYYALDHLAGEVDIKALSDRIMDLRDEIYVFLR